MYISVTVEALRSLLAQQPRLKRCKRYFIAGHGYGASVAVSEVTESPDLVGAVVLIGAVGSHDRDVFPLPVFTTNGDLDGEVRITMTAESFR